VQKLLEVTLNVVTRALGNLTENPSTTRLRVVKTAPRREIRCADKSRHDLFRRYHLLEDDGIEWPLVGGLRMLHPVREPAGVVE